MTTLPTTPKVKTLIEQTPTLEKWESKTLAWVHLLTDVPMPDGYKPSSKYPGWGWAELSALPTTPTQDTPDECKNGWTNTPSQPGLDGSPVLLRSPTRRNTTHRRWDLCE